MSALSNLPAQAVLPLAAYDLDGLLRDAQRADQRVLRADLTGAPDRAAVLTAIGRDFGLPDHYGANLDALADCLSELKPLPEAEPPGVVVILQGLQGVPGLDAKGREALIDVFRDAADELFDQHLAFRVFY